MRQREQALKGKEIEKEGVVRVSVNYFQGTGDVVYDPDKIAIEEIVKSIQPYTATVIEDKELG